VPLLIYFLAKNLVRGKESMRWLTGALFIIAAYLVFLTAHEHLTGRELFVIYGRVSEYGENLTRVNSLLQNPAYIALALDLVLPFIVRAALRTEDARRRWGFGLAVVAVLAAVFSLYNRAGWAGALLVILVSALHYPRLRRWCLATLALAVPVVAGFWTVLSAKAVVAERLLYGLSVGYRLRAFDAVWQLMGRQPIFGVGFGNFSTLSLSEGLITSFTSNYWVPTTHNSYLDVLVSAGVAALLPYVATFVLLGREIWLLHRRAKAESAVDRTLVVALGAAFAAFVVCIATFDIAAAPFCAMLFWLIAGGVLGSQNWPTLWAHQAQPQETEA
jgi:O-antigen ligase